MLASYMTRELSSMLGKLVPGKGVLEALELEVSLIKRALQHIPTSDGQWSLKVKVPEPKPFSGVRREKDVENLI